MPQMEVMFSEEAIATRVRELGAIITRDYADGALVVVGVLNGAFIFLADLVRAIDLPMNVDFIRVASYGDSTSSSGTVRCTKEVEVDLAGKDVLLVEDIVDSGRTMASLKEMFSGCQARSVRICALIDKRERREVEVVVDYPGFVAEEGFLVGYGLDYAGQHRHYPAVYRITGLD